MSEYQPTRVAKFSDPATPSGVKFCKLELGFRTEMKGGGSKKTELGDIRVYRAAVGETDDKLYLLDIVCSAMEYRAVHACLTSSVTAKFKFRGSGSIGTYRTLEREKDFGYRTYIERFYVGGNRASSLIHYLAVSNHPSFLPSVDPVSTARKLNEPTFSAPFLTPTLHGEGHPDWIPYIMDEMIARKMLSYLRCHSCNSGFLLHREQVLQDIISDGVRKGILKWPDYDPNEIWTANNEAKNKKREAVSA